MNKTNTRAGCCARVLPAGAGLRGPARHISYTTHVSRYTYVTCALYVITITIIIMIIHYVPVCVYIYIYIHICIYVTYVYSMYYTQATRWTSYTYVCIIHSYAIMPMYVLCIIPMYLCIYYVLYAGYKMDDTVAVEKNPIVIAEEQTYINIRIRAQYNVVNNT